MLNIACNLCGEIHGDCPICGTVLTSENHCPGCDYDDVTDYDRPDHETATFRQALEYDYSVDPATKAKYLGRHFDI